MLLFSLHINVTYKFIYVLHRFMRTTASPQRKKAGPRPFQHAMFLIAFGRRVACHWWLLSHLLLRCSRNHCFYLHFLEAYSARVSQCASDSNWASAATVIIFVYNHYLFKHFLVKHIDNDYKQRIVKSTISTSEEQKELLLRSCTFLKTSSSSLPEALKKSEKIQAIVVKAAKSTAGSDVNIRRLRWQGRERRLIHPFRCYRELSLSRFRSSSLELYIPEPICVRNTHTQKRTTDLHTFADAAFGVYNAGVHELGITRAIFMLIYLEAERAIAEYSKHFIYRGATPILRVWQINFVSGFTLVDRTLCGWRAALSLAPLRADARELSVAAARNDNLSPPSRYGLSVVPAIHFDEPTPNSTSTANYERYANRSTKINAVLMWVAWMPGVDRRNSTHKHTRIRYSNRLSAELHHKLVTGCCVHLALIRANNLHSCIRVYYIYYTRRAVRNVCNAVTTSVISLQLLWLAGRQWSSAAAVCAQQLSATQLCIHLLLVVGEDSTEREKQQQQQHKEEYKREKEHLYATYYKCTSILATELLLLWVMLCTSSDRNISSAVFRIHIYFAENLLEKHYDDNVDDVFAYVLLRTKTMPPPRCHEADPHTDTRII
ncbi:unnamed protein product [Trichogramma brassicae]|uniref:Uncharacterized protein n=1 Tax=Trichogramma brassicae TaxID=86971 RepID=A0A6H5IU89_9HYME|nr:unnamed protein product [Trichogramma brassicae]